MPSDGDTTADPLESARTEAIDASSADLDAQLSRAVIGRFTDRPVSITTGVRARAIVRRVRRRAAPAGSAPDAGRT